MIAALFILTGLLLFACGFALCNDWKDRRAERAEQSLREVRAELRDYRALAESQRLLYLKKEGELDAANVRAMHAESAARWRIVNVDTTGRGPNADATYHVPPPHNGAEVWLTDEQLLAAKVRPATSAKRTYETP